MIKTHLYATLPQNNSLGIKAASLQRKKLYLMAISQTISLTHNLEHKKKSVDAPQKGIKKGQERGVRSDNQKK